MRLAVGLLLLVALTHYGYEPIAALWPGNVAGAVFYILRGIEGAGLFALLVAHPHYGWPVQLVAAWGFVEEAQTAICRIGKGVMTAPAVEPYQGLCGWPAYSIGVILMAAIAAVLVSARRERCV